MTEDRTGLADALRQADTWAVPHAGVVVVGRDGVLAQHGETTRVLPIASVA